MPDETDYWLALNRLPDLGAIARRSLLERYGDAKAIYRAPPGELETVLADRPQVLRGIREGIDPVSLAADHQWLAEPDTHVIPLTDPRYPPLLAAIPDPPLLLYLRGTPACLADPQLAIVGSRNPTATGIETTRAFAGHLVHCGITVTSGLALGIDAAAHAGALDAGGHTIAVLGTGPDRVYPARHRELAHRIAARGALVSEFPPGTPPLKHHFPRRNRLISGLALGVLVTEAALRSGSLITARYAGEQGREVFAIPGSIHSPLARGCHRLIRQGAKLVETATDILEELGPLSGVSASDIPPSTPVTTADEPDPDQLRLLSALGHGPADLETLCRRCGLTPAEVSSMLLIMELQGRVQAGPGGAYVRIQHEV